MFTKEELEKRLKNDKGEYFSLKLSSLCDDVSTEDFIPYDIEYPNARRYSIYSYDDDTEMIEAPHYELSEDKEQVVKALKKIHGIVDPWDDDPDYFKRKLKE